MFVNVSTSMNFKFIKEIHQDNYSKATFDVLRSNRNCFPINTFSLAIWPMKNKQLFLPSISTEKIKFR